MELFLNLCWLMLLLPAYWVWRGEPATGKELGLCRSRTLVLLACVLILLFPVVSATDDLHVIRPDIEEPGSSKRMVRASVADRSSCGSSNLGNVPALLSIFSLYRGTELSGCFIAQPVLLSEPVDLGTNACRAPPASRPC